MAYVQDKDAIWGYGNDSSEMTPLFIVKSSGTFTLRSWEVRTEHSSTGRSC